MLPVRPIACWSPRACPSREQPGTHAFTLQKLLDSGKSTTLRHERLQLEFTPNPAWTAVQALPYLMGSRMPAPNRSSAGTTPTAWQATWWGEATDPRGLRTMA